MKHRNAALSVALVGVLAAASVGAAPTRTDCPASATGMEHSLASIGASYSDSNAIFYTPLSQPATGSGVIDSFVRISANTDCIQGYNTTDRDLQFDENNSGTFTHDLLLSSIPTLEVNGVLYREFILDINQENSDPLLTLNQVRIFSGANQATNTAAGDFDTTTGNLGSLTPIYTLGAHYLRLNYLNYGGSGAGIDMVLLVKDSLFGAGPNVYLYSFFGVPHNNNDGYEEWAVRKEGTVTCPPGDWTCEPQEIPEPGSLVLLGVGLLGVGLAAMRRRKTA